MESAGIGCIAIAQLCRVLNRCEAQCRVPAIMTATWSALPPPAKIPAMPLDLRPIAVVSVVWRAYASCRCKTLQNWMDDGMPQQLYAYRRDRSSVQVVLKLGKAIDLARLEGRQLHVLSLDASKAFPTATRWQLFHVMRRKGCSEKVIATLENFYEQTSTVYRMMGKFISLGAASPLRGGGVYHGCPLSVLCFSSLQVSLIEFMETHVPSIEADDVSFWSSHKDQIELLLPHVERFYQQSGVVLNAKKTQYWTLRSEGDVLQLAQTQLSAADSISILGHTYDRRGNNMVGTGSKVAEKFIRQIQWLEELPMSESAKEKREGSHVHCRPFILALPLGDHHAWHTTT